MSLGNIGQGEAVQSVSVLLAHLGEILQSQVRIEQPRGIIRWVIPPLDPAVCYLRVSGRSIDKIVEVWNQVTLVPHRRVHLRPKLVVQAELPEAVERSDQEVLVERLVTV